MTSGGMKPITEQIIDDLLSRLYKSEIYDESIITKLKEATSKGKLPSFKTVIDIITTPEV
jgi:hypothetical protein